MVEICTQPTFWELPTICSLFRELFVTRDRSIHLSPNVLNLLWSSGSGKQNGEPRRSQSLRLEKARNSGYFQNCNTDHPQTMVEGGFDCTHVTIDQKPPFNETSKSLLEKQVRQNLIIWHFFPHTQFLAQLFSMCVNCNKTNSVTKQWKSQPRFRFLISSHL